MATVPSPESHSARSSRKRFRLEVLRTADAGVTRETILEQADAMRGGLILLEAPAGFGKTYALAQCCDRALHARHAVAWLGLRSADRDLATLCIRMVAAIRDAGLESSPGNLAADTPDTTTDPAIWVAQLARSVSAHPRRVLLVLDDYQTIEGSQADQLLVQLFEQLPANLRSDLQAVVCARSCLRACSCKAVCIEWRRGRFCSRKRKPVRFSLAPSVPRS